MIRKVLRTLLKPNIPPNNSVAWCPLTALLVASTVEGGHSEVRKRDTAGRAGSLRNEPARPLKVATRVRIPLGLLMKWPVSDPLGVVTGRVVCFHRAVLAHCDRNHRGQRRQLGEGSIRMI